MRKVNLANGSRIHVGNRSDSERFRGSTTYLDVACEDRPQDLHVVPCYGKEHESSAECWCQPEVSHVEPRPDLGRPARIWMHREDN